MTRACSEDEGKIRLPRPPKSTRSIITKMTAEANDRRGKRRGHPLPGDLKTFDLFTALSRKAAGQCKVGSLGGGEG